MRISAAIVLVTLLIWSIPSILELHSSILTGTVAVEPIYSNVLGENVSLIHPNMRTIEYLRYLGNGLMVAFSKGGSSLYVLDTDNDEIKYAVTLPCYDELGDITYIGIHDNLLVVTGLYETIVYYLNSTMINAYYLARRDNVGGHYGGRINRTLILYNKSAYLVYDPVTGEIRNEVGVDGRLVLLHVWRDEIYGIIGDEDRGEYVLLLWGHNGLRRYPIITDLDSDVEEFAVSPNGSYAAIIVEKYGKYSLILVNTLENTSSTVYDWEFYGFKNINWLNEWDLLITRCCDYVLYRIGTGVIYQSEYGMGLTYYIGGGYIILNSIRNLTLYVYNGSGIMEKGNLTLPNHERLRNINVVDGFVHNDRIYLALALRYWGSRSYAGGIICFNQNGGIEYSLVTSIEPIYSFTYGPYVVELVYDWINGSRQLWITGGDGEYYRLNIPADGDYRHVFMTDKYIGFEIIDSPYVTIYVYDYRTGRLIIKQSFKTIKDLATYTIIGDKVVLGYYCSWNNTVYIAVIDEYGEYWVWSTSGILRDLVIGSRVYLVESQRIITYNPLSNETMEIEASSVASAAGVNKDIYFEAATITSIGLFVQAVESGTHNAVIGLLDTSSLSVLRAKALDKHGRIPPGFHPVSLGNYVVTYMDYYVLVPLDTLEPVEFSYWYLTASPETGYIYALASSTGGEYDKLIIYGPDGSIIREEHLPIPVEPSSIYPNTVTATGKYLVFQANDEYLVIYDTMGNKFYTIYSAGTYPQPLAQSDRFAIVLPIGTIIIGELVQPPQEEYPGQTTTTTTITTTTSTTTPSPTTTTTTTKTTTTTTSATTKTQQTTQRTEQPGINYGVIIAIIVVIIAALGVFVFLKR